MPNESQTEVGTNQNGNEGEKEEACTTEPPAPKRVKRAKYVGRACAPCQRRKIKCQGGTPCTQCVAGGKECTAGKRQSESRGAGNESAPQSFSVSNSNVGSAGNGDSNDVLSRLMSVERQLKSVLSNQSASRSKFYEFPERLPGTEITDRDSPQPPNLVQEHRKTFVGEMSLSPTVRQTREHLGDSDLEPQASNFIANEAPLTPKPYSTLNANAEKNSRTWLRTILLSYGIVPDEQQWTGFLATFFGEVHVLYPFLHQATVLNTHKFLWQSSLFIASSDLSRSETESKISVAILFLCLACGRCTGSARVDNADGRHSAGWSLYSVAMYLLRDILDLTQDHQPSLGSTQALAVMVVYLFRLDANEKAEKIMAQLVSTAHILGLHRKSTYENMSLFEDEMFRRLWWCMYTLDRRLSLETGRPFLIQNVDMDTDMPTNMGDDWLEKQKSSTATRNEYQTEVEMEIARAKSTPIPFLIAMLSYSKVVGFVWKIVYSPRSTSHYDFSLSELSLGVVIEQNREQLPPNLRYQISKPFDDQFAGMQWWQIKQALLLHLRYTFLELLMRNPRTAATGAKSIPYSDILANDATCCELASGVISLFASIPDKYPKQTFPFIHYLTSAILIMISVVSRNPAFKKSYKILIMSAVKMMTVYCRKTWVSGKLMRTILKLDKMAHDIKEPDSAVLPASEAFDGTGQMGKGGRTGPPHMETGQMSPVSHQNAPTSVSTQPKRAISSTNTNQSLQQIPAVTNIPQAESSALLVEMRDHCDAASMQPRPHSGYYLTTDSGLMSPASIRSLATINEQYFSVRSQSTTDQPRHTQHLANQNTPQTSFVDASSLFTVSASSECAFSDLPSWAMTDFDFEMEINANGGGAGLEIPWELPDLETNILQL